MRFLKKLFIMLILIGTANFAEAKKALVVYFSHTENTKLIAEDVQKELLDLGYNVDIKRIETKEAYPGYGDELKSRSEQR